MFLIEIRILFLVTFQFMLLLLILGMLSTMTNWVCLPLKFKKSQWWNAVACSEEAIKACLIPSVSFIPFIDYG